MLVWAEGRPGCLAHTYVLGEGHPSTGLPRLAKRGGFQTFVPKYREHRAIIMTKF